MSGHEAFEIFTALERFIGQWYGIVGMSAVRRSGSGGRGGLEKTKLVVAVGVDQGFWLEPWSSGVHQRSVSGLLVRLLEMYWVGLPRSFEQCFWGHGSRLDF